MTVIWFIHQCNELLMIYNISWRTICINLHQPLPVTCHSDEFHIHIKNILFPKLHHVITVPYLCYYGQNFITWIRRPNVQRIMELYSSSLTDLIWDAKWVRYFDSYAITHQIFYILK